jgi:DNA repair protein RadA/Sms
VLLSLVSSFRNRPIPGQILALGEIGLSGEIRPVSYLDKRIQEAAKMGYKTVVLPKANKMDSKTSMEVLPVDNVNAVLDLFF